MGKGFVSKHVPGSYALLRYASAEVQAVVDATEGILRTGDLHLRPGEHTRFIPIHDHFNHFLLKFSKIQNKSDLNRITIGLYSISPRISNKFSKHGIFPNYPNPMIKDGHGPAMRPGRPALATLAWPWARMRSRRDGSPAWSDHLPGEMMKILGGWDMMGFILWIVSVIIVMGVSVGLFHPISMSIWNNYTDAFPQDS
jgi:hypothetical protein